MLRLSISPGPVGGEWAALPPSVAVSLPQGFTFSLVVSACLDPGRGDCAAGRRATPGLVGGGRNPGLLHLLLYL